MSSFLRVIVATVACLSLTACAEAATYYVRTDGGTSTQCTGLADAAYPGSGTNQACALSHPFWVLSPAGAPNKMVGGDTLIIGPGEYRMGLGAPNTPTCSQYYPWDCFMRAIPSGTTTNPTRILGKGWDTGCSSKPQLWGTERSARVMSLQGSNNVQVQCLEITDHSSCMDSGPDLATRCNRSTYPYGDWALTGIVASDSENVLIKNVNVHGLRAGVTAGRIKDWTIENTDINTNSFVGWDGDIGATASSNNGRISFKNTNIKWNGCGETYPGLQPHHCYSQDQGGYGDGIGTNKTAGDWVFDHVDISYNVSDGLDLLYHDGNGSITISHSRFEGNAGNQVKTAASTVIDNSKMIGSCAFFQGKSFTSTTDINFSPRAFNNCRAAGTTVTLAFKPGMRAEIYNSTVTSNGDVVVISSGASCLSTDKIISKNNIYIGGIEYNDGSDLSDLYYASGQYGNGDGTCGSIPFVTSNDIIWGTKYNSVECNGTTSKCVNPQINGTLTFGGADQDVSLKSTSPAIGTGVVVSGITTTDFNNFERGSIWDIGAMEYGSVATTAGSSSSPTTTTTTVTTPPSAPTSPTTSTGTTSGSTSTSGSTTTSTGTTSGSASTGTTSTGTTSGSTSTGSTSTGTTSGSTSTGSTSTGTTSGSTSTGTTSGSTTTSTGSTSTTTSSGSSTGSTWGGTVNTGTTTTTTTTSGTTSGTTSTSTGTTSGATSTGSTSGTTSTSTGSTSTGSTSTGSTSTTTSTGSTSTGATSGSTTTSTGSTSGSTSTGTTSTGTTSTGSTSGSTSTGSTSTGSTSTGSASTGTTSGSTSTGSTSTGSTSGSTSTGSTSGSTSTGTSTGSTSTGSTSTGSTSTGSTSGSTSTGSTTTSTGSTSGTASTGTTSTGSTSGTTSTGSTSTSTGTTSGSTSTGSASGSTSGWSGGTSTGSTSTGSTLTGSTSTSSTSSSTSSTTSTSTNSVSTDSSSKTDSSKETAKSSTSTTSTSSGSSGGSTGSSSGGTSSGSGSGGSGWGKGGSSGSSSGSSLIGSVKFESADFFNTSKDSNSTKSNKYVESSTSLSEQSTAFLGSNVDSLSTDTATKLAEETAGWIQGADQNSEVIVSEEKTVIEPLEQEQPEVLPENIIEMPPLLPIIEMNLINNVVPFVMGPDAMSVVLQNSIETQYADLIQQISEAVVPVEEQGDLTKAETTGGWMPQ